MAKLNVNICGVNFKNPVIAASGTFGFGKEFDEIYDISCLGGISTKGLTLEPRLGNPTPRIAEAHGVILNSVGLQNPGVDVFLRDDLDFLKSKHIAIVANVAGRTLEDYEGICARLDGLVDMIELNISCPNVRCGGMAFGIRPESVKEATRVAKSALKHTPLMVKLSPNVESIPANARAAEEGRRGRAVAHQYTQRYGHRHRTAQALFCQRHGGRVGRGHPPDRGAHGLGGVQRGRHPRHGHGRHHLRRGRAAIFIPRGRGRGAGGHGELLGYPRHAQDH